LTFTEIVWRVVGTVAIVGGSALLGGWLSVIASVAATRQRLAPEASRSLEASIPVVAMAIGSVFALEFLFGLPMISVSLTFGAMVGACALAAVPLLANVVVGIGHRLRERVPVGARLVTERFHGTVTATDWLGVRLEREGAEVLVPWLWLLVRPAEVRGIGPERVTVPLRLGLATDLEAASASLAAAAAGVAGVLDEPRPDVVVEQVTGRGVEVVLRLAVEPGHAEPVRSRVVAAVVAVLRDGDVEIAA